MALDTKNGYGKDMGCKYVIVCDVWYTRLIHEPGTSTGYAGTAGNPDHVIMFTLGADGGKGSEATFYLLRRIGRADL